MFLENLDKEIALIVGSPVHDVEKIRRIAHSLKSSCANVGAQKLSELCKQLELRIKTQSGEEIQTLISEIETESQHVKDFFLNNNITSILLIEEQS